jgi:ZIP family zinc transporter/zinc and cadmium transporter
MAVTLPGRLGERRLNHLIAFGAGYMLAAAFVSMAPESFELSAAAPMWILAGYAVAHLTEHTFTSHFHFGEETHHEHALKPAVSRSALVGLALHSFFDGVAISSGFLVTFSLGVFISLAVILHKIPEGVTIASVMVAAGQTRSRAMGAAGILAGATLLGAVFMHQLASHRGPALALSCGIAVYVAATDLIPELNQRREKDYSVSALLGLVLYFGILWLMKSAGIHE